MLRVVARRRRRKRSWRRGEMEADGVQEISRGGRKKGKPGWMRKEAAVWSFHCCRVKLRVMAWVRVQRDRHALVNGIEIKHRE